MKTSKNIKTTCGNILFTIIEYLKSLPELESIDKTKSEYIVSSVSNLFNHIFEEAEKMAYENYIKGMSTMEVHITSALLETISKRLDRNIYFLDSNTRMPCNDKITSNIIAERKSIVLLQLDKGKYETVGRLLPDNKVQREFSIDDPLVKCLNMYILSPKKFIKEYPNIAPFIPHGYNEKEKRDNNKDNNREDTSSEESDFSDNSRSESSSSRSASGESDKYYDSSSDSSSDSDTQSSEK